MSTLTANIQLRRDTATNWTTNNPILLAGELAFTTDLFYSGTDQQRFKIGDGIQTWSQLDYVPESIGFPEILYLTVVNKTGDNLLASGYKVVKVSSAQGQRLAVDYALANSDANSADTIGIVYENIDNNQEGKIVVVGQLTGLNTTGSLQGENWNEGDLIYLSPNVSGGITNIKPIAPNHLVTLGYVEYKHAINGKLYIKIDNGYELGELHNVYAPSPNNNDGIFWSSGTTRYENKSISTVLGFTPENSSKKGVANGYAPLGSDIKVDASYLPSYVSDILEYANLASFPVTGQSGKIYLALDTNKVYRWSGSVYIEVSANSGTWGAITGTLSNQTDLQSALDAKKDYVLLVFNHGAFNITSNRYYQIGSRYTLPPVASVSDPGTGAYGIFTSTVTGIIEEITLDWYNGSGSINSPNTFSIRNYTTNQTTSFLTNTTFSAFNNSKRITTNISINAGDLFAGLVYFGTQTSPATSVYSTWTLKIRLL